MPNRVEKFTRSTASLLTAEGREYWIRDTEVVGLAIRVSPAGNGAYFMTRKIDGRLIRARIAKVEEVSHVEARSEAKRLGASMTLTGVSPNAAKKERRRQHATLAMAYADYIDGRGIKSTTLSNYERSMRLYLDRWHNTALTEITRDDVRRHHAACSKISVSSTTTAFRLLRAIFNYADGHYLDLEGRPILLDNPVKELSRKRLWSKPKARTARLRREDFAPWFAALPLIDPKLADYLRFVLFTGLRRREATTLEWSCVDLTAEVPTVRIDETKNGDPLLIPLSDAAVEVLCARKRGDQSNWVFPSAQSKSGHIEEPKSSVAKLSALTGISVSPHALRRTFVSVAESIDIGPYTIKRLVNHRSGGDVTEAHYIDIELPRLHAATVSITSVMLSYAGLSTSASVVPLRTHL